MTRFELANKLNSRLYMLTESERHRIINKYISDINTAVADGINEADAITALGDIDRLADVILARHHIDTARISPEEKYGDTEESVPETAEKPGDGKKAGILEKLKDKAGRINIPHRPEAADSTMEKADHKTTVAGTVQKVTENTAAAAKKAAGKTTNIFSRLFSFTADVTFGFVNLLLFCIVWIPCMLITVAGITCTITALTLYIFSGIGFMGVCIAGIGCCVMGIAFTAWLGNILTGGKKRCEEW
ncbi:MAG: hypothetical protein IJ410_00360 [Oscillospiraceae bacterium]|nr:hypothetical protein [Oscillospiraceae bacterium]